VPERRPSPAGSLNWGKVEVLALFNQGRQFPYEAALFPTLSSRPQFNRLMRRDQSAITAFAP
jgi:hypothetical protein